MLKFVIGVVVGIAVSTVGFSGLAKIADNGVAQVQTVAKDVAK